MRFDVSSLSHVCAPSLFSQRIHKVTAVQNSVRGTAESSPVCIPGTILNATTFFFHLKSVPNAIIAERKAAHRPSATQKTTCPPNATNRRRNRLRLKAYRRGDGSIIPSLGAIKRKPCRSTSLMENSKGKWICTRTKVQQLFFLISNKLD